MKLKELLYNHCQLFIDNRFKTIQNTINEIQDSLTTETKSSAGDKHETGRAMLQLEREKAGQQLAEIQKVNHILSKIDISKSSEIVTLGSIVYTTQANYFVAISAGEVTVENEKFYAISAITPIAQLIIGKQKGELISFRNLEFEITKVV
ncbi:3-oxoacyl-ACP synthase [Psychroserpens damuponensis]|uniref:3-oxoacyl-ACP synthase n=1 Tax=Psychroserpens damuponensis TaxID=943936 RepID=UPI00058E1856|nr:3-oxoacyl-ACP synthase [Psychroserpens damuponensis]